VFATCAQAGDTDSFTDVDTDHASTIEKRLVQLGPTNATARTAWKSTLHEVSVIEVSDATDRPMYGKQNAEFVEYGEGIGHEALAAGLVDRR
jgi:hypothetical protein